MGAKKPPSEAYKYPGRLPGTHSAAVTAAGRDARPISGLYKFLHSVLSWNRHAGNKGNKKAAVHAAAASKNRSCSRRLIAQLFPVAGRDAQPIMGLYKSVALHLSSCCAFIIITNAPLVKARSSVQFDSIWSVSP